MSIQFLNIPFVKYIIQVDVAAFLDSKYAIHTVKSENSSFDNFKELLKYKFHPESIENLVQCAQKPGPITIKYRDIIFDVNQDLFYLKINQTMNEMYQSPDDYKIDSKYIHALNICLSSKSTFQHFYRHTAHLMITHLHPVIVQNYLDQLIFDIRIRKSPSDFCEMYEENLYFYVKIATDTNFSWDSHKTDENLNYLVYSLLNNLKSKDLLKFVILRTHFSAYRSLKFDQFTFFRNILK